MTPRIWVDLYVKDHLTESQFHVTEFLLLIHMEVDRGAHVEGMT